MSDQKNNINLDEPKKFYDPHPGLLGAAAPIPKAVKKAADQINGRTMTLREAVVELRKATKGEISVEKDCILLSCLGANGGGHIWRVIRYR